MKNLVANAVFIKDKKLLLEKRKKDEDNYAGLWAFPGGHKKKTEKIKNTLLREMKEELKVKITECKFIKMFKDIDPTSKKPYHHHFFLCTKWTGKIKKTTEEERIKWFTLNQIKSLSHVSKPTLKALKEITL